MENKKNLTLCVIIPCSRVNTIEKCLSSLLKQSRPADEIIVVHSVDSSIGKILDSFQNLHESNIKKVLSKDPGVVSALNVGIKNCDSDIICFIDDDAIARKNWLKLIEKHYSDSGTGAVGGRDVLYDKNTVLEEESDIVGKITWYGRVIGNHHNIIKGIRSVDYLKGCNMSCRKELVDCMDENLRFRQESLAEPHWEIDIALSIKNKGYKILFDPKIVVDHYIATSLQDRERRRPPAIRNEAYIFLKHFGIIRKLVYLIFSFSIGCKASPGILWFLVDAAKTKTMIHIQKMFAVYMRSRIEGVKLYFKKGIQQNAGVTAQ